MQWSRYIVGLVFALGLGFGLSAWAAGCDDGDDGDGGEGSTCLSEGVLVAIVDNHNVLGGDHELTVSATDVVAGVDKTYDIRGDNTGHTHTVTVSAEDFAALAVGTSVTLISSNNGSAGQSHTHEIRLSCP